MQSSTPYLEENEAEVNSLNNEKVDVNNHQSLLEQLHKTEEEIITLRQVLNVKLRLAQDIKRQLGITAIHEMKGDIMQSINSIKESNTYKATTDVIKNVKEKTTSTISTASSKFSQKIGIFKNSNTFKSIEGKMGNAYTSMRDGERRNFLIQANDAGNCCELGEIGNFKRNEDFGKIEQFTDELIKFEERESKINEMLKPVLEIIKDESLLKTSQYESEENVGSHLSGSNCKISQKWEPMVDIMYNVKEENISEDFEDRVAISQLNQFDVQENIEDVEKISLGNCKEEDSRSRVIDISESLIVKDEILTTSESAGNEKFGRLDCNEIFFKEEIDYQNEKNEIFDIRHLTYENDEKSKKSKYEKNELNTGYAVNKCKNISSNKRKPRHKPISERKENKIKSCDRKEQKKQNNFKLKRKMLWSSASDSNSETFEEGCRKSKLSRTTEEDWKSLVTIEDIDENQSRQISGTLNITHKKLNSSSKSEMIEECRVENLRKLNFDIRSNLMLGKENYEKCLELLNSLSEIRINLVPLVQVWQLIDTVKKCRRYKKNVQVKEKAQSVYDKLMKIYLNATGEEITIAESIIVKYRQDNNIISNGTDIPMSLADVFHSKLSVPIKGNQSLIENNVGNKQLKESHTKDVMGLVEPKIDNYFLSKDLESKANEILSKIENNLKEQQKIDEAVSVNVSRSRKERKAENKKDVRIKRQIDGVRTVGQKKDERIRSSCLDVTDHHSWNMSIEDRYKENRDSLDDRIEFLLKNSFFPNFSPEKIDLIENITVNIEEDPIFYSTNQIPLSSIPERRHVKQTKSRKEIDIYEMLGV